MAYYSGRNDDDQTESSSSIGSRNKSTKLPSNIDDNDNIYYNQTSADTKRRIRSDLDHSDENNTFSTLQSNDLQDWKCRECGFTNKSTYTKCETCDTSKPIHPLIEKRPTYSERRSSMSPSNRRSSSTESENMFNQSDSTSSEQSYSKTNISHETYSHKYSSDRSRTRRKSSHSSSDDDQYQYSTNNNKQTQSSKNEQTRKRPEDDDKFVNKNDIHDMHSTNYESDKYGKTDSRHYDNFHTSSLASNYVSQKDNKIHESKSSLQSPPSYSSLYKGDKYQSMKQQQQDSSQSSLSSKISSRDDPIVAYIPDLPANIENNQTLEDMIRQCLKLKHKQKIIDVKCNTKLGIGIIYLHNNEDKHDLINNIEKAIIESSSNTTISFVDQLELISYVVIDETDMKNLPSSNDICQRWIQLYKTKPKCEQLSVQFPNIYRIVTYSLDELIQSLSIKDFSINNRFATVYFRADCCFFEDLPRTTNYNRLKEAISKQISDKYMSKESIHIQYNKDGANAVVITSERARIWSLHNSISLDGKSFMKKDSLACRLIIRSVPKDVSLSLIQRQKIFGDSVTKTLSSSEHVILEIGDRNIYEKCIEQGTLRIGDHLLGIEVYTFSSNPEDSEIDNENWYETEMCDHKSDITPFMSNPQHPIFKFKWNSRAFLEQLRRWTSTDRNKNSEKDQDKYEKLANLKRHLLRMTVMLNTIGIIKKGFYRIGEKEIKLKLDRLKTIKYDHKSKLQRSKTVSISEATKYPYKSTLVKVVNEDCLIVHKHLVSKGHQPVVLNMANAHSPGGGYRRGDGAQEETLFRRSNYYQSLDVELDNGKPTARFYCNSNCDLEPFNEGDKLYSMDDFGAIYTSGLTVFRQPEDTGYEFMDIPMYDVCAIAMAAYRDPKIDNKNFLTSKYSINTRKKIENIFSIAYHHKHDSIVLSALGCGAFKNPPEHIAMIFKSVIEQYAGFFKCIYFAIVDDHNAHQDLNPTGNYRPFQKLLDNLDIEPKRHKILDVMIGPWRILNQTTNNEITLSDIRICYLTPCHYGGKCNDIENDQHCREYSHPSLCPNTDNITSCKEKNDDQHMLWYRHRQKCSDGGECRLLEDKNNLKHLNEFEHPEFCHDGGKCENMNHQHLKSYRHVPLCKYRHQCVDYNRRPNEHCEKFRHCIPMCRFGHFCVRFHDEKHMNEENHPFQRPCPLTPFHCRQYNTLSEAKNIKTLPIDIQNHCLKYSHVCRYGRQCHETSDIHWKNTIHVARNICLYGDDCKKLHQEDHLNSFSHKGIPDIRGLCVYPGSECRDKRKVDHIKEYRHHGNHDYSGVIGCFGQNKYINFIENQNNIIKAINDYIKSPLSIPLDIQKWIQILQPIHRCSKVIFESILVHGHVMSREHMDHLKKPSFVAQAIQEHKRIRSIFDRYKTITIEDHGKEYIKAIVSLEYTKKYSGGTAINPITGLPMTPGMPPSSDDHNTTLKIQERFLKQMLKPEEIYTIRKYAIDIAEASWNLHNSPTGIKYPPDKILGTDKHVFSIIGPHLGHYYGDIFLVFKNEVMLHPDSNFSPQAATSFSSGATFGYRPWVKDPGTDQDRVKCFHQSKLHCSIPGYEYAAAAELMAVTGSSKKTMNSDLKSIINRWKNVDSHQVFEAHLPQLVPLDYIDEVYIPKNLFASLTPAAQESANKIFRKSLHITDHKINLNHTGGGGSQPSDKSRADYQDFVIDKLIEKFRERMKRPNHYRGTVITLVPSQFSNHIVLPLTINDAYDQYHRIHKQDSNNDETFIYWQSMSGDMMITLSNEPINPNRNQPNIRCLVCYIAEIPSTTTTTNYNESYSYLDAGEPYKHGILINHGRCSATSSSRSFHRGCDIEGYLTYCLKIDKKTGEVILSHAGPNSIYCYETITAKFSKTQLDLNKLKYIHVSAGSQKVPIRNLIVTFKQISDLHPSFDKNYRKGDDSFAQPKKSHGRDKSPNKKSTDSQAPREKSPSFLNKAANAIGNFFGFDGDNKILEPCPYSSNCRLQTSSKHTKDYSHPCPDGSTCRNKTSEHQIQYTHSKKQADTRNNNRHETLSSYDGQDDQRIPCRYGRDCYEKNDRQHCLKYSHPDEHKSKPSASAGDERTPCRYGHDCYDKNNPQHCSKYSHPDEHKSKPSTSASDERTPCRYGHDCYDKNNQQHCSKYSHPNEHKSKPSTSASDERTPCRYGRDCHDKNNPQHCSKYSHPHK